MYWVSSGCRAETVVVVVAVVAVALVAVGAIPSVVP